MQGSVMEGIAKVSRLALVAALSVVALLVCAPDAEAGLLRWLWNRHRDRVEQRQESREAGDAGPLRRLFFPRARARGC